MPPDVAHNMLEVIKSVRDAAQDNVRSLQHGGGSEKFTVTDPDGNPHVFDTQEQADTFKRLIAAAKGH